MNEILFLCFLLTLSIGLVLTYHFKKYLIDSYRQKIFKIRDEFFDYAASGEISFDHPAYGMARTYLNGSIRFTERISLFQMFIASHVMKAHKSHFEHKMNSTLVGLGKAQKKMIVTVLNDASTQTIVYLVKKNLILIGLFGLIKCAAVIRKVLGTRRIRISLEKKYRATYSDVIYAEGAGRIPTPMGISCQPA